LGALCAPGWVRLPFSSATNAFASAAPSARGEALAAAAAVSRRRSVPREEIHLHLQAIPHIPFDGIVRDTASKIAPNAGADTLTRARTIYGVRVADSATWKSLRKSGDITTREVKV
jgi:hypothetical protein